MINYVQIQTGQFALCMEQHHLSMKGDPASNVEGIARMFETWDYVRSCHDIYFIVEVGSVSKKTFRTTGGRRHTRDLVIASAQSKQAAEALRDRLHSISVDAEKAYQDGCAEFQNKVASKVIADAINKVHSAMPHIFGRASA